MSLGFILALIMFTAYLFSSIDFVHVSIPVILSFVINAIFSLTFIVREVFNRPYSLAMIYWIFSFVFFGLAPLSMYLSEYYPWAYSLSDDTCFFANILILIWNMCFLLAYKGLGSNLSLKIRASRVETNRAEDLLPRRSFLFVSFVCSVIALGILVQLVGFENLFSRSDYDFESLPLSVSLIADKGLRGVIFINAAYQIYAFRKKQRNSITLLLSLMVLLIGCFPLGMARYTMAAIYMGLLLIAFPFVFRKGVFPVVLLLGLLIVFPASNAFRTTSFSMEVLISSFINALAGLAEGFYSADFDAYSMLCRAIEYVNQAGVSYGANFVGALLFFIPRSIWPDKPFGTGRLISEYQGQNYTNLSCPLPAEFYVALGVVGVIVGSFLVGIICRKIDERCASSLFYPFLIILFFFMCRGDLMSSFAYIVGYLAVYLVIRWLNRLMAREESLTD